MQVFAIAGRETQSPHVRSVSVHIGCLVGGVKRSTTTSDGLTALQKPEKFVNRDCTHEETEQEFSVRPLRTNNSRESLVVEAGRAGGNWGLDT